MPSGFVFEARPTFRDLQGRFAKAEKDLLDQRLPLMRELGQRFVEYAGQEARGGPGHTIAKQVGFATFNEGELVGFRTRLGPIARWHLEGTGLYGPRGRLIQPVRAKVLHFIVRGHEVFSMWVRGVRSDAYIGRAYRRWLPGARAELRRISTRYAGIIANE